MNSLVDPQTIALDLRVTEAPGNTAGPDLELVIQDLDRWTTTEPAYAGPCICSVSPGYAADAR